MDVDGRNFRRANSGFGEILRELRGSRRISQLQLARLVGVNHSYISRLERGTRAPSPGLVQRLSAALHLDADEQARLAQAAGYLVPLWRGALDPFQVDELRYGAAYGLTLKRALAVVERRAEQLPSAVQLALACALLTVTDVVVRAGEHLWTVRNEAG